MHRNVSVCKCERIADKARAFFAFVFNDDFSQARTLPKVVLFCVCHESVACVCKLVVRNIINI